MEVSVIMKIIVLLLVILSITKIATITSCLVMDLDNEIIAKKTYEYMIVSDYDEL